MKETPGEFSIADIISDCEKNINGIKEDEKKLGNLVRERISTLTKDLEKHGLHLPEFIVLEYTLVDPQGKFDEEKVRTIEYFRGSNQLIKVERTINKDKDFHIGGLTFGTEIPRRDQKEVIKELDSKSWIKYAPQITHAFRVLSQNKVSQKS